ncbi:hypothetical protein Taro_015514 [Colocasia esculenta]|uniref:Uncharacterized protein n=1 Tax=Colocasia esculenta TaxID=4460 RepID=A0A843UMJ4_COLES|nr:hypothetical protein [Colocasia esculenta]
MAMEGRFVPLPGVGSARSRAVERRGTRPSSSFFLPDGGAAREGRRRRRAQTAAAAKGGGSGGGGWSNSGEAERRRLGQQRRAGVGPLAAAAGASGGYPTQGSRRQQQKGEPAAASPLLQTGGYGGGGSFSFAPPSSSNSGGAQQWLETWCLVHQKLKPPGAVGVSIALEKIFHHPSLEIKHSRSEPTYSFLICSKGGGGMLEERMELAAELWQANMKAEFVPLSDPSLTLQYEYAYEHDIKCLLIIASGFAQTGSVKV